jgi:cbb3-type cytochrome oxidase maturation protein
MEVLVILVPLALGLGLAGLVAFLWSLKNGQYEDLDGDGDYSALLTSLMRGSVASIRLR